MLDAELTVRRRSFDVAVRLRVAAGERLSLFGPSGSGKTTVLEALSGLVPIVSGRIVLDGRLLSDGRRSVPAWDRGVALLRQDAALFPHLDVAANIRYGASREEDDRVLRLMERLGLGGIMAARPRDLSGGQAQRVALVRALAARRSALLLDEPYTGLDQRLRHELTQLVREEVASLGIPSVLVAHELEEAQAFADKLAVIDSGQLLQVGTPGEVVRLPASLKVAELVGYRGVVDLPGSGGSVRLAVHPERVRPGPHPTLGPVIDGVVSACRASGVGWELEVSVTAGASVACRTDRPVRAGERLAITIVDAPAYDREGVLVVDGTPSDTLPALACLAARPNRPGGGA